MTEPTRKKNTGELTDNGGHFGSKNLRDADFGGLSHEQRRFATVATSVELQQHEPLPEWPEHIEKPGVTLDFNDGFLTAYFTFRDLDSYQFHAWVEENGDISDSINDIGEPKADGWSVKDAEQVTGWARAVTSNLDADVYGITHNGALSIADELIAHATESPAAESPLTDAEKAAARVRRTLPAFATGPDDEVETKVADAIADIIHFAKAEGFDFDQLLERARCYVEEETDE